MNKTKDLSRRLPQMSMRISILLALSTYAICVAILFQIWNDAWQHEGDEANNLSLVIERDVSRNLDLYNLSLQRVIEDLRQSQPDALAEDFRQQMLLDHAATSEAFDSIFVLDKSGKVTISLGHRSHGSANFSDRDYFQVQRDNPAVGLYVSHPYNSRSAGGAPSIALSRRISNPDGSFAGIVVGAVRLSYFEHLVAGLDLGAHGIVALLSTDGTILMQCPNGADVVGEKIRDPVIFSRMAAAQEGTFIDSGMIDGVRRLYRFRHIGDYPLIVIVAPSTEDVLATWRAKAWLIASLMALLGAAIIFFAILFSRELRRRQAAEDRLTLMVRTDALTGLYNRGELNLMLATEWNRASRSARPLSLLFIDIDHFKSYNDIYGHQAGDIALIAVAKVIGSCSRRSSDVATRYGGEEFVLLLPDTDEKSAAEIGQKLLASVRSLDIPHAGDPCGYVTVSIGVACSASVDASDVQALLKAADHAVYDAKEAGRNRLCVASSHREYPLKLSRSDEPLACSAGGAHPAPPLRGG
jgi:diguanylate cyclase (GGDEF)-like protein